MGNPPQSISPNDLYEYTHGWTAVRLRSFPLWEFDDIRHEAYVAGLGLIPKYDPRFGDIHQYLSQRLYDYVSRSYYKKNDIVVTRKRAKDRSLGKREYNCLLIYVPNLEGFANLLHYDPQPHDFPDFSVLPDAIRETAYMLSRNSKKDCAKLALVSQSAVTQRVRKLRDMFSDELN